MVLDAYSPSILRLCDACKAVLLGWQHFIVSVYVKLAVQLFPYHLADYTCRVLRVTPFRYYIDLLFTVMREEKSYDQIPNFTVRPASPTLHLPAQPPCASECKNPRQMLAAHRCASQKLQT